MGLLTGLLTLPLAPLRGTVAVAEQVLRQAEETYYNPAAIRQELEQVDELRRAGEITEEEATAWEDQLIERMMVARGGS
jgi:polyhydroxyalkanoate synthesis regulator phasin